jgi:predicted HNH restriction endonuclease
MNCEICQRDTPEQYQEKHHLIPKTICKRNKYAKEPQDITIEVCKNCGDMLHKLFSIKDLADSYNTLEKILSNDDVKKWVVWANKKPNDFNVCMRDKKKR